jgi:diaminopimelate decarboxylase
MIIGTFPVKQLNAIETPFYYYDMSVLRDTLRELLVEASEPNWRVHYAVKACATKPILQTIAANGIGADCVSGGEIKAAIEAGFSPDKIVFAGVAKTDKEILYALRQGILCFNVESLEELHVISQLAIETQTRARVCLRVNPNIDAHTHEKITTGLSENKFGIPISFLQQAISLCYRLPSIDFLGLHFHLGSQITDMQPFVQLADKVNELVHMIEQWTCRNERGETEPVVVRHINVGGGLGILYEHPNHFPIPNFKDYFALWRTHLQLRADQYLHFEPGRSIVAQCGNLMTRVLYVKHGENKQFAIVDAGMTDLIRPALYGAYHRVENLTHPDADEQLYDIVGPICESSDVFAKGYSIAAVQRGDLLVMRSAGAYGEIMASQYNLRRLPGHVISDDLQNI